MLALLVYEFCRHARRWLRGGGVIAALASAGLAVYVQWPLASARATAVYDQAVEQLTQQLTTTLLQATEQTPHKERTP